MKTIPPKNPHFFKPILPGFKKGLNIPMTFLIKYLKGQGSKFAAILRRGDRRWPVKISGRNVAGGWEKFAADNSLHIGDFVVFCHEGDSVFDVSVFDSTLCEREFPLPPNESNQKPAHFEGNYECISSSDEGSDQETERAEDTYIKKHVSCPEHKRTSTSKDDHPFFVSTLNHYSLTLSRLNIPSDFARENGLWNRKCMMILRDLKQRLWSVELDCTRNQVCIKHGWDKFCSANRLVEGETFVFELVDNGEMPIAKVYAQGTTSTASAYHPHFVSTIKPYSLKKQHVYFPMEFVKSHGLVAKKREMTLRDDKERSWPVVVGRSGKHFGLLNGWREFQMANGLKEGDVYKFELIEGGKRPIAKFHLERISKGSASTSYADHPHFVSTIKPYSIKNPILYLPMEFAKSHGLAARKREMILRDDKERSWSVVLARRERHIVIRNGWREFQMANGLKEGDSYKFELIKSGKKPIAKIHCHFSGQEN